MCLPRHNFRRDKDAERMKQPQKPEKQKLYTLRLKSGHVVAAFAFNRGHALKLIGKEHPGLNIERSDPIEEFDPEDMGKGRIVLFVEPLSGSSGGTP